MEDFFGKIDGDGNDDDVGFLREFGVFEFCVAVGNENFHSPILEEFGKKRAHATVAANNAYKRIHYFFFRFFLILLTSFFACSTTFFTAFLACFFLSAGILSTAWSTDFLRSLAKSVAADLTDFRPEPPFSTSSLIVLRRSEPFFGEKSSPRDAPAMRPAASDLSPFNIV